MPYERTDAYDIHDFGERARVVLTCEHASERIPEALARDEDPVWPDEDAWLRGTHWSYDLGAEALAVEYARAVGARLVCARFSRLFVDPNRPLGHPTLFRREAEGRVIALNASLSDDEQRLRIERLYAPFHDAVDRTVASSPEAEIVLAIHTFTPVYEGRRRTLEIGVLFDREDELGRRIAAGLADAGFRVAENEPYSGKDGLIHVAATHGDRYGKRALELEVRQDLATDPAFRARLVPVLARLVG